MQTRQVKIDAITKSASRKATAVCWLGSGVVIGQFSLISYGTFEYLSWDIMEPICYLMTFSNFTFGYFFYLAMKRDLDLTNFHDILAFRLKTRAAKRQGLDLDLHDA